MANDRLLRILARLGDDRAPPTRLCAVCAEITEMSGAGIMLMPGDRPQGSVCTTDEISALIEDLQYTLGEGPCIDAHHLHQPVIEPDLADPAVVRWPAFAPPAIDGGVWAVFGFPIAVGAVRIGALNLYRDRPGPLRLDQHDDAVLLADVAGRVIINMQADAAPGDLGLQLLVGSNLRFVVHQAAGMVSVQLAVSVEDAMIRLRAHAFRHDRRLDDVAHDVISRRLRFDPPQEHTEA